MTQKKTIPKKHQNAFNALNVLNVLNVRQRKNVPDRCLMKKKKAIEEVQKIGIQRVERVERSSLKKRA